MKKVSGNSEYSVGSASQLACTSSKTQHHSIRDQFIVQNVNYIQSSFIPPAL